MADLRELINAHRIDYFLNGTINERSSIIKYLIEYGNGDDLIRRLLRSFVGGPISTSDLGATIASFTKAKAAYDIAAKTEDTDGPVWDAYEAAEHAVIVHPCRTIEDVRLKAKFFLEREGPNDTLRNSYDNEDRAIDTFLRSLLGETQP